MTAAARSWQEWLADGRTRLERAGIDEAETKLRWVAAHLLGGGLLDVLRREAEMPSPEQSERLAAALARLETDEPVQYVVGETDFMGLRIRCDRRALIPRPETELLAECAEEFLRERGGRPVAVDVGTGTGCIACALAARLPRLRMIATDVRPEALELARENARALGVEVEFREADLLAGLPAESADLVVSNPPYVDSLECDRLPRTVRAFEPRTALDGGRKGLETISRLVSEAAHVLRSGGRLMMEIGDDQAEAVEDILCPTTPFQFQKLKSDFAGRARVVLAERKAR